MVTECVMNKKIALIIVLGIVCVSFCGCSWTKSISEDDKKLIAAYSAKMVAKYNTKQKDGIVYIDNDDALKAVSDLEKEQKKKQEESAAANTTNSTSSSKSKNQQAEVKPAVPLETALGLTNVNFAYLGSEVRDSYTTSVYDMTPSAGNKFLVMRFRMTANADGEVNILSKNPKFKATINQGATATNEISLMPDDLATFKGTLKAGESRDLVILFQFKGDDLANIQSTTLQCTSNGGTSDITL